MNLKSHHASDRILRLFIFGGAALIVFLLSIVFLLAKNVYARQEFVPVETLASLEQIESVSDEKLENNLGEAQVSTEIQISNELQEPVEPQVPQEDILLFMPIIKANHPWQNPIGIETHRILGPDRPVTGLMTDLNPGWVRMNERVSWRELQPSMSSTIQWHLLADFETELETLASIGTQPIVIIDDYPLWATSDSSTCSALKPEYYDDFANFVGQVVNRYKAYVKNWEMGNEIDIDPSLVNAQSIYGCWGDIDDEEYYGGYQYGEMIKVVGQAIKSTDSGANVWLGGLLIGLPPEEDARTPGKPERFLRGVLAAGAAPYFDILPYHAHGLYYGNYSDSYISSENPWVKYGWGDGVLGKAAYLRSVMQEFGVDKPLMVNEITYGCNEPSTGVPCDPPDPEFYDLKADMSIRIAVRVLSDNMLGIVWYTLEGPGWRLGGLLNEDNTKQPAYDSVQVLGQQLKGSPFIGSVNYDNDQIEAYAFKRNGAKQLHIVWAKTNTNTTIDIPKASFVQAVDSRGNPVTPTDAGSIYQISVGFSPVFIERLP